MQGHWSKRRGFGLLAVGPRGGWGVHPRHSTTCDYKTKARFSPKSLAVRDSARLPSEDIVRNPTWSKRDVTLYLGQDPRYESCQLCSWKCACWYLVSLKLQGSDWFMNLLILRANNLSLQIFRGIASLLFLWSCSYLPPRARASTAAFGSPVSPGDSAGTSPSSCLRDTLRTWCSEPFLLLFP